jgi:hypothetical protein
VFIAGLVAVFVGTWWLMPAAAMIVLGVVLMLLAIGSELAVQRRQIGPG